MMGAAPGRSLSTTRRLTAAALVVTFVAMLDARPAPARPDLGGTISVLIREAPGAGAAPERAVQALRGTVGRHIGIVESFVAEIPRGALSALRSVPEIVSVSPNARVELLGSGSSGSGSYTSDPTKPQGYWWNVATNTRLIDMWDAGYMGTGIDVAVIDSGVAPVPGLTTNVINGPDLSFESQAPNLRHLDTYGHGTHMAGLIGGGIWTTGKPTSTGKGSGANAMDQMFLGAAPMARIVSVKVASSDGATDVSQVLAAIDWIVEHKNSDGLNIRVLNLSFGTDGVQDYMIDPLAYAVEVAWMHGIVVVVAAGNSGFGTPQLNNPAYDPYVIAVGAVDTRGTDDPSDDVIPSWQSRGNAVRHPDIVAPGQSIISLRDPGSYVDEKHPYARLADLKYFKGSGSSQATAIVSGAVATLLQQRPELTPDQVKALLMKTATPLPNADQVAQGAGLVNLRAARDAHRRVYVNAVQTWPRSTGVGSLHLARGSVVVQDAGMMLEGEQDIFGDAWDGAAWATLSWNGTAWEGGSWLGRTWSGSCWCGESWAGRTWSGIDWTGRTWSGLEWTGRTWSGRTWSADGWSAGSWDETEAPSALTSGAWSSTVWGV